MNQAMLKFYRNPMNVFIHFVNGRGSLFFQDSLAITNLVKC